MPKPKLLVSLKNKFFSKNKSESKQTKPKDNTTADGTDDTCDITMSSLQRREDTPSSPASLVPMMQRSGDNVGGGCGSQGEPKPLLSPQQSDSYGSRTEPKQVHGSHDGRGERDTPSFISGYETMTPSPSLDSGMPSGGSLGESNPSSPVHSSTDINHPDYPPEAMNSLDSVKSGGVSGQYPTVIERHLNEGATVCIKHSPRDEEVGAAEASRGHASAPIAPVRGSKQSKVPTHHSAPVAVARGAGSQDLGSSRKILRPFVNVDVGGSESDGELFPDSALSTPIGALRKSRKRLCLMLNIEQLMVDTDYPPDYTGLAELLGFDAIAIQNFWERNPADSLFMDWARCHDGSLLSPDLRTLVECLDTLKRQDVLQDCRGLILEDVRDFIAEQQLLRSYTVGRLDKFDCYVNIAEQDLLTIGREILDTLEGVYRLRLCLTLRDVTLGGCQFEKMAEMLETRCNSKVVIVLSKSYVDSDACQFLTQFAVTLDPGSRKNKLIPLLVEEDIVIPRVLRCLAMLNYHRDKRLGFLWPRLKHAISQ